MCDIADWFWREEEQTSISYYAKLTADKQREEVQNIINNAHKDEESR